MKKMERQTPEQAFQDIRVMHKMLYRAMRTFETSGIIESGSNWSAEARQVLDWLYGLENTLVFILYSDDQPGETEKGSANTEPSS